MTNNVLTIPATFAPVLREDLTNRNGDLTGYKCAFSEHGMDLKTIKASLKAAHPLATAKKIKEMANEILRDGHEARLLLATAALYHARREHGMTPVNFKVTKTSFTLTGAKITDDDASAELKAKEAEIATLKAQADAQARRLAELEALIAGKLA